MKNKHVLIVEDHYIVAYALQLFLQGQGYTNVNISRNGEDALKVTQEAENLPLLYIMDIGFGKGMNGIEAAKAIKNINSNAKFIFVSGQEEGINIPASVDPFIALGKPIDNDELLNMIQIVLSESHSLNNK